MNKKIQGMAAETEAISLYKGLGFDLYQKNVRFKRGELDLILVSRSSPKTLLFVEVRSRSKFGVCTQSMIPESKVSQVRKLAKRYVAAHQKQLVSMGVEFIRIEFCLLNAHQWQRFDSVVQ